MKKQVIIIVSVLLVSISASVMAQSKAEIKEQKKADKEAQISSLLESGRYQFSAQRAVTNLKSKPFVNLTTDNYCVEIKPDSIVSYLPFYGRAYSAPIYSTESPLDYISTDFKYDLKIRERKKNTLYIVNLESKPEKKTDRIYSTLEISPGGSATLIIQSNNLSRITFYGEIEALE